MKRLLTLLALAPFLGGCYLVAAAGAGYVVSQQVLPNNVHVAQLSLDVDVVWPSAKETLRIYQEPGSELAVQESPRVIHAKVNGATVTVEVEAIDLDRSNVRVTAEKYLSKDNATATEVLNAIVERINRDE